MINRIKTVAVILTALLGMGLLFIQSVPAKALNMTEVEFEPYYVLGEMLNIPTAKITISGTEYETLRIVHTPEGKAFQTNKVILDQLGKYQVEYRAVVNGRLENETFEFIVVNSRYNMGHPNSKGLYGVDESIHNTNLTGLHVSLARGDIFEYNQIIDLSKLGKNQPFIQMSVLPSGGFGTKDVKKLFIELIDIHNPSNVVKIVGNAVDDDGGVDKWWSSYLYLQAGAEGRPTAGIEWVRGQLHVNNEWGYPSLFSMYGMQGSQNVIGKETLSFLFDLDEKQLFGPAGRNGNFIIDLDDKAYVDVPWNGFTTGEVYMKISADGYSRQTFDFVITGLAGQDLSPEYVFDVDGPAINIHSEYEDTNYPTAVKGYSYPVFEATSFDAYTRQSDLSVRVFYNYFAQQRFEVPIKNGRFETKRTGTYTIEYTSRDAYQNESKRLVHIESIDTIITIEGELIGDYVTEGSVGHRVGIATIETSGGIGNLQTHVYAELNGVRTPIEGNTFRPQEPGVYTINYNVSDLVGQTKVLSYELEIVESEDPIFLEDPVLPEYIIADKAYTFNQLFAYDFISNQEVLSELFVNDGQGSNQLVTGGTFRFKPNNEGVAILTYRATSTTGMTSITFTIPVITVYQNGLDMKAYFDSNNLTKVATTEHIALSTIESKIADFTFIQPLSAELFQLRFRIDPLKQGFNEFKVVLRDPITHETIEISYKKHPSNSKIQVFVNGELLAYEPAVQFNQGGELRLQYHNKTRTLVFDGLTSRTVTQNHLGTPFKGFESSLVYFEGHILGVTGQAGVWITNLNGQLLSNDTEDFVKPIVYLKDDYLSAYKYGTVATIYSALALDVLDPEVLSSVTVRTPSGEIAKSKDGISLDRVSLSRDYEIDLNQYGSYVVTYSARDSFGSGNVSFNYSLFVEDDLRPVITIQGSNPTESKKGQLVTVKVAIVTDNVTNDLKASIFVITPRGEFISITNTKSFTPTLTGTYTIRYFAMDASGNTTFVDSVLNVK